MLVLEMGPSASGSGSVSVSIKQRVFDPDTDTDPDPEDSIASSLAGSRGQDLGDRESVSKLLQRKQDIPITRRLGRASAPTFR